MRGPNHGLDLLTSLFFSPPFDLRQIPEIVTTMLACTRIGAPHRYVRVRGSRLGLPGVGPTNAPLLTCCDRYYPPYLSTHSVVFAGFSAEAVRDRVNDAQSKWVVTADEGKRGGKTIPLKQIVDKALEQ